MSSFDLETQEQLDAGVTHIHAVGELDLTNAGELEERLEELSREDGSALLLDLNRVVFIDSAALHVLFRTARRLGRARFGIVCAPSAPVARALAIVALPEAATVGENEEKVLPVLGRS
jgi:anti-anti-sigma factor